MENKEVLNNENKVEQSKDNSKKKGILKYVLNILLWGIIIGLFAYGGCKMIDQKTGYKFLPNHSAVVVSNSMSYVNEVNYTYLDKDVPHIKKGDVIHTTNYKNFDEVKPVDDIVIYFIEDGTLICHRVVDKYVDNGINWVVTRGDTNTIDDAPVNFELVRGKVTSVTGGGGAVLFFQSPYLILALCCSGFFIILGYIIFNLKTEKKAAGVESESVVVEEQPIEDSKEQPVVKEEPVKEEVKEADNPTEEVSEPAAEEPEPVEEKSEEQLKVEESPEPVKKNSKFIPKGGGQKRLNWPPKNTRWTKENNPSANKKRAEGGTNNEK